MSFISIGIIMLIIVLMHYWRAFGNRGPTKPSKSKIEAIIDKVEVFEALAKDSEALRFLEQELEKQPEDPTLLAKKKTLLARLSELENDRSMPD